MKKDKRARNTSMSDIVGDMAVNERKASGNIIIGSSGYTEEEKIAMSRLSPGIKPVQMMNTEEDLKQEKAILEYNEKIKTLDPLYKSVQPIRKVLVRCFAKEVTRTAGGLIIPPDEIEVKVPTQAGHGYVETVKSPWAFSTRAIVVATPSRYTESETQPIKVGKMVQLAGNVLIPKKDGKEIAFHLPTSFTHWSYQSDKIPQNMSDPHYGYFLIYDTEIDVILD